MFFSSRRKEPKAARGRQCEHAGVAAPDPRTHHGVAGTSPSIRHCRPSSGSCLDSVPHWNCGLLHPPQAAQPYVPRRGEPQRTVVGYRLGTPGRAPSRVSCAQESVVRQSQGCWVLVGLVPMKFGCRGRWLSKLSSGGPHLTALLEWVVLGRGERVRSQAAVLRRGASVMRRDPC